MCFGLGLAKLDQLSRASRPTRQYCKLQPATCERARSQQLTIIEAVLQLERIAHSNARKPRVVDFKTRREQRARAVL